MRSTSYCSIMTASGWKAKSSFSTFLLGPEKRYQRFFWNPPNLPHFLSFFSFFYFFSFFSVLEWWHDGYSYRRRLKLHFLKLILYSLKGYPLLCQFPFFKPKFLQVQKSLHVEILNGWKEKGKWLKGFKLMTHCFKIFFPSWILVLLFSNLFFSCLIFPQLWQYSWSQMWEHFLKMPVVEAGKQVGKNHQRNLWSLGQRQKTHQYCTNRTAGILIEKIKLQVRK